MGMPNKGYAEAKRIQSRYDIIFSTVAFFVFTLVMVAIFAFVQPNPCS